MQNKSTLIGYILIFVLFVAYFVLNKNNVEELERQKKAEADSLAKVEQVDVPTTTSTPQITAEDIERSNSKTLSLPTFDAKFYEIKNDVVRFKVSSKGGMPSEVELLKYKRYDQSPLILFEDGQSHINYTIPTATGDNIVSSDLEFNLVENTGSKLVLKADIDSVKSIVKTFEFNEKKRNQYPINYSVSFNGFENSFSPKNQYIQLQWDQFVQSQEKNLEEERNTSTVYYRYQSESGVSSLSETKDDNKKLKQGINWISFKQKFFNATLMYDDGFMEDGNQIESRLATSDSYVKYFQSDIYLPVNRKNVEEFNFTLYYGPNHYQILKTFDNSMQKIIPLGWGIFGWVNKAFVIPIFNFLEQYFSNYGIIILLLTLAIKLILFFPMFKTYKSTAKMKLLKPELDEIKAKHEGDMTKQQQEQMKLYKQAGVNPLEGCLPQLVQLPILFAMFRFFPSSIELRQQKLWWADDLSSYDSIYDFPAGFSIPFYGDHISLFTLLMTAVTLIYTFTNSQATGQLQGPMKYMMYLMPIFFLGFFNNYAAALSFYYFLATCITIIQNFFIKKFFIDEEKLMKQIQMAKTKKVSVKKSSFQKRLEDMAKKRGIDPNNPNIKKRKK